MKSGDIGITWFCMNRLVNYQPNANRLEKVIKFVGTMEKLVEHSSKWWSSCHSKAPTVWETPPMPEPPTRTVVKVIQLKSEATMQKAFRRKNSIAVEFKKDINFIRWLFKWFKVQQVVNFPCPRGLYPDFGWSPEKEAMIKMLCWKFSLFSTCAKLDCPGAHSGIDWPHAPKEKWPKE